jgi:hypothetical protein
MNPREAVLLSPYRPPTSYPVSLNPDEAEAWLNGYFALWHPAVLAAVGRPPQTASVYDHDVPREGHIYTVPAGPTVYQAADWTEQVKRVNGVSFAATADAAETATNRAAAVELFEQQSPGTIPPELLTVPADVVRMFEAIGYGYLLIESLFDAASHDHLLDAEGFWADVTAALDAARSAERTREVRQHLKTATEKLSAARQVLNTNTLRLIDFVIPGRDSLDAPWPASLHAGLPLAVIASGECLVELAERHPERFAELKAKVHPDLPSAVDLCVGVQVERDDTLLPAESQLWNLTAARETTKRLFGVEPAVFARTRSAFHPHLPAWLQHTGFKNAVLVSFDGATTPNRNAVVVNWSAPDGKAIDAFARDPLDAADPLTFFNLVYSIHQAFNNDSSPTVALKHTGRPAAVGYAQLVALADLGDACGEWAPLGRFLADYHYGDYLGSTTADDYFSDHLDDRVTTRKLPRPVSGFADHLRMRRRLDAAFTLAALHRSLTPAGEDEVGLLKDLERVETDVEGSREPAASALPVGSRLPELESEFARILADRIQVRSAENQPGLLVFNPCNFTRRVALEIDDFGGPIPVADPVKAAEFSGRAAKLVVEVPSLGFAWVPRNGNAPLPKPRIKTAENGTVRNEFLEADFDTATGAIRAVRDLRGRVNRLGMQLVYNPGSRTKARSVTVTNAGAALGEVVCDGDITDEHDQVLCRFRQRLRAWVGRPVLELRIELDPVHSPTGYPWHAYYGARFAWRDPRSAIFRGANGSNERSTSNKPISPDYVELRLGAERTFVFTGGLPFVQKHADRMADVVLMPEGEQGRAFELLLAFDRDLPMQTAQGWVTPSPVVLTTKGPPHIGPTGWLAHIDLPSLLMTSLRPGEPDEGYTRAVTMRLMETAGFGGASDVRFARDPNRVRLIDGAGVAGAELTVAEGGAAIDFSANETLRVKAEWV